MAEDAGFLGRWARRKEEARQGKGFGGAGRRRRRHPGRSRSACGRDASRKPGA